MKDVAKEILYNLGGDKNIQSMTYCATRLRPTLNDYSKANVDSLRKIDGVVGIVDDPGRFQIIIGTHVADVYNEIIEMSDIGKEKQLDIVVEDDMEQINKDSGSIFNNFVSFVVAIFNPLLVLFAGSGLIRGLTILAVELGWLAEEGTTNALLTVAGTAIFHFLPIVLAVSAARRLKVNPYIAAIIMGILIMPDFVALGGVEYGTTISFFGLNVEIFNYSGQVITPIILVWLQSKIEPFLKEKLPTSLHLVFIGTLLITILFPVAILIVGPLSNYISIGLANAVNYVVSWNSIVTGAIIGGIWNVLILFGVHWAPNTMVIIPEIAQTGQSALIAYGANANFGMAGAALAIYLKTKNRELKAFSMNSMVSVFLSGIVEPAIYGLGVPFKTPLIAGSLGAALGGAFMGAFNVVGYTFIFGGLTTIPAFAGPTLIYYVIGLLISFVSGMLLTFLFGWNEQEGAGAELYGK